MPTNPYSSQAIAGYNASAPPDDGSFVAANQLEWAKHKTKLGDPIKTLAEAIDAAALAAFDALIMTDDPGEETVQVAVEEYQPGYIIQAVLNTSKSSTTTNFAGDLTAPNVHTIVMLQEFL